MKPTAIVLLSGGLDSATVAAQAIVDGYTVIALSLNYGQRHVRELVAPLVLDSKADIVRRAVQLGVPIAQTWSCYQGDAEPCGLCDSCRIRDRALIEAGCADLATAIGRSLYSRSR